MLSLAMRVGSTSKNSAAIKQARRSLDEAGVNDVRQPDDQTTGRAVSPSTRAALPRDFRAVVGEELSRVAVPQTGNYFSQILHCRLRAEPPLPASHVGTHPPRGERDHNDAAVPKVRGEPLNQHIERGLAGRVGQR